MQRLRLSGLVGLILCLAVSAAAQGPAGTGSSPRARSHAGPHTFSSPDFTPWQLSVDYQYNMINLTGSAFTTHGLSTDVTRYFGRWFGLEGQLGFGFGNTGSTSSPSNLTARSLFAGAGPRVAFRHHSGLEPWLHFVAGVDHFRFTQTAGVLGSNTAFAFAAGGGIDYLLGPRMAVRVEADAIESRFFSGNQRHFQVVSGLVFNF